MKIQTRAKIAYIKLTLLVGSTLNSSVEATADFLQGVVMRGLNRLDNRMDAAYAIRAQELSNIRKAFTAKEIRLNEQLSRLGQEEQEAASKVISATAV